MAIQLTNTLTGKKEPFHPMVPGEVRMYVCGPTVYNLTHIGNHRPVIFFDVVRRFLEYSGFKVTFVSNFTDVDDKIINRAREEGISSFEVAEKYVKAFKEDVAALGVRSPTYAPRVTEHIPGIIAFIDALVQKGAAYVAPNGEVFYSVRNFAGYGKLSKKQLDDLRVGARVDPNEQKRDPLDFSLWKPQKAADEPAWDSPWGKGRPGWHIECSAMAFALLGETFDIHGGGIDLSFPHHENEIAQSEGRTGKTFARYWLHNNLLNIGGEKMSKSIGNIMLCREFVKTYGAETLKFLILSGHYRSPIEFSEKHIRETQAGLHRIYSCLLKARSISGEAAGVDTSAEAKKAAQLVDGLLLGFREAMEDDLNTAKAIADVFYCVRAINALLDKRGFKLTRTSAQIVEKFLEATRQIGSVLNLFEQEPATFLDSLRDQWLAAQGITRDWINERIVARVAARAKKDFAGADAIRDELLSKGIELRDAGSQTSWDVAVTK